MFRKKHRLLFHGISKPIQMNSVTLDKTRTDVQIAVIMSLGHKCLTEYSPADQLLFTVYAFTLYTRIVSCLLLSRMPLVDSATI